MNNILELNVGILEHPQEAKIEIILCIYTVSPGPSLIAYTSNRMAVRRFEYRRKRSGDLTDQY